MAYYTLSLDSSYDPSLNSCGLPESILGLSGPSSIDIVVPFAQQVEGPISVQNDGWCNTFTKVLVTITATCEQSSPNSQVVQYKVKPGYPITLDYNMSHATTASSSSVVLPDSAGEPVADSLSRLPLMSMECRRCSRMRSIR